MVVTEPDSSIGVSLNLNHFHEMMENGGNYAAVLNRMSETVSMGNQERPNVDIQNFS